MMSRGTAVGMALAACTFVALLSMPGAALAAHRPIHRRHESSARVREIPVTFSVLNQDASKVSCQTDGKRYTIAGTLILPAGQTPSGVTLYAHGLGYASYFWDFSEVPGYDYAGYEAEHGHASVVIDRLGYGASGKPEGNESCIGGQATILHEIIGDLRDGDYGADATSAPSFARIGLVGHSIGAEIAEVEAYSFHDVNALGVMDFDEGDYSALTYSSFAADSINCATGGQDVAPGGPAGYSPFGATTADYDAEMFHDVAPAVERDANALRTLDPCGDVTSTPESTAISLTQDGTIDVPVAFVWGQDDALFPEGLPWAQTQESLYRGSPKVSNFEIPDSGHAVTLARTAPVLQRDMNGWLSANGL